MKVIKKYVERVVFDKYNNFVTAHKPVSEVKITRTKDNQLIVRYEREAEETIFTNNTDDFKSEITIINDSDWKTFKTELDAVLDILPKIKHKAIEVDINTNDYYGLSDMDEEGLCKRHNGCVFMIADHFPEGKIKIRC